MFRLTILLLILFFSLISCDQKTPLQLNNELAAINDTINQKLTAWVDVLEVALDKDEYSILAPHRLDFQSYLEKKIEEVSALRDVKGSKPLREAELVFLNYELGSVGALAAFETFDANTGVSELRQASDSLKKYLDYERSEAGSRLLKAQQNYAKRNHFRLTFPSDM